MSKLQESEIHFQYIVIDYYLIIINIVLILISNFFI